MKFSFTVYSRRWGYTDTYCIEHNSVGWHVSHMALNGQCTPDGTPYLYGNFEQGLINYPSGFAGMLTNLWDLIDCGAITQTFAQSRIQQLADWVSNTEKNTPKWPGYNESPARGLV